MWQQIRANQRRSVVLVVCMAAVLFGLGYLLAEVLAGPGRGPLGLAGAFAVWLLLTLLAYYRGDTLFLHLSGARQIEKKDHPVLFNVVEEMVIAAGLAKMPAVYIIDQAAPNAFATGRKPDRAAVAVTAGLLELLDRDELQGVIAHELGHVKNRDVLYMLMVGVMLGSIVMLADIGLRSFLWSGGGRRRTSSGSGSGSGQAQVIMIVLTLVLMILAPLLAQLIYFTLSRKREYLADASAAQYTRFPDGLARALEKISVRPGQLEKASRVTAPSYIVNPLRQAKGKEKRSLFSTHPPTQERVRILRAMAGGADYRAYDEAFRKVTRRPVGVVPAGALSVLPPIAVRPPAESSGPLAPLDRVRMTTDLLWHLNDFIFLTCVCGTILKIPPAHKGKVIDCPHCRTPHRA